eukprot:jgi/Psemu1/13858/gm1.13858_g
MTAAPSLSHFVGPTVFFTTIIHHLLCTALSNSNQTATSIPFTSTAYNIDPSPDIPRPRINSSLLSTTPIVSPTLGYSFSPSPAPVLLPFLLVTPTPHRNTDVDATSNDRTPTTAVTSTPFTSTAYQTTPTPIALRNALQLRSSHVSLGRRSTQSYARTLNPTQSDLNAVFSWILPNISSLFIVDDDGVKTLRLDPIPVLKSLIVAAIMDELPPSEVSNAHKRHISSLIAKTTIFWHSKAIGGRIQVRDKQVLDIAAKHAKRGRPIIQLVLNIIHWKFDSEWYPYEFHKAYGAADGIPSDKTGLSVKPPSRSQLHRTKPTAPVVSETLPVPSSPTIVPPSTTDLVQTKTTVPIPRAGASPVTTNLGTLQPVGPIANTPSVPTPRYMWTWTYSPNSESVSFRQIRSDSFLRTTSSSPPVQRQEESSIVTAPSVTPSTLTRFGHHSVPPYVPANFRWTFNPQNEIATFHCLPKPATVPLKPPSRLPLSDATADDPLCIQQFMQSIKLRLAAPRIRSTQVDFHNQLFDASHGQPICGHLLLYKTDIMTTCKSSFPLMGLVDPFHWNAIEGFQFTFKGNSPYDEQLHTLSPINRAPESLRFHPIPFQLTLQTSVNHTHLRLPIKPTETANQTYNYIQFPTTGVDLLFINIQPPILAPR